MLNNTSIPLSQNKLLQNIVIIVAVLAAAALFIITFTNLGLLHFGSPAEFVPTTGSVVLQTKDFKFVQEEMRVSAGTEVQLALSNNDILAHSFDVDELDLHIAMPANDSAEATITITQPGAYTFYCAIPGHRGAGMIGTLIVKS
jgi:uncharacterized cupredoxin-like copper-binding protein